MIFSGKEAGVTGQPGFFWAAAAAAPTGVPTDRKEHLQAEEAAVGVMQGWSKKRGEGGQRLWAWSGNYFTLLYKQKNIPWVFPFFFFATLFILFPPCDPCYYLVFGHSHPCALIKGDPARRFLRGVFCAPWRRRTWISGKYKRRWMWVTSLLLGGMHPCPPPLCNSTWHFYYAWNWYNLLRPLATFI